MAEMAAMDTAGAMVRQPLQTERLCTPFQPGLLSALAALAEQAEQAATAAKASVEMPSEVAPTAKATPSWSPAN